MGTIKTLLAPKIQLLGSKEKRHEFILALIIISLPYSIPINSVLIILLLLNATIRPENQKFNIVSRIPLLLISLPFVISSLALLYSNNMDRGFFILEKNLSLVVFPLVFLLSCKLEQNSIERLLTIFLFNMVFAGVICFGHSILLILSNNSLIDQTKLLDREYYYITYSYLSGGVGMNPIYLGMYVNFSIALSIEKILNNSSKAVHILIFLFLSVLLMLLMSKINIIIYIILLIFTFLYRIKYIKYIILYLILAVFFVLFMLFLVEPIKDRVININYFTYDINQSHIGFWNGANLRMAIWKCAMDPIKDNWLLGVGTGDEKEALLNAYKDNGFKLGLITEYNTHNQWLEFSLRFGMVFSLMIISTNFILPLIIGYKTDYKLFIFMVIISLASLTEVILATQKGVVFYSLFATLFLSQKPFKSENE